MRAPAEVVTEWLEARGLDADLAARMGWSAGIGKTGEVWVKIPYLRGGERLYHQYRKVAVKDFRNDPGSEKEFWNVDAIYDQTLTGEPLIIAEGACDGLAAIQCGFVRTIAVPGWSVQGAKQVDGDSKSVGIFERHRKQFGIDQPIIVAVDADDAGASLLRTIVHLFPEQDIRWTKWPDDCKDLNDVLMLHGVDTARECIRTANRIDPPGGVITGFSDAPPRPSRRVLKMGWDQFDQRLSFRTRAISVTTGIPNSGKSAFMLFVADYLVRTHGLRVGLATFEMEDDEIFEQLFVSRTSMSLESASEEKIAEIKAQLDRQYRIVHRVDSQDGEDVDHSISWVKDLIRVLAVRDQCDLILIDPWNEIEHVLAQGENITTYITFILTKIRHWAEMYDIHVNIVAHPPKMERKKIPLGYDIAGSSAWYDKVDLGLTIHRRENDTVQLINWKTKSRRRMGCSPGKLELEFDQTTMRYRPA